MAQTAPLQHALRALALFVPLFLLGACSSGQATEEVASSVDPGDGISTPETSNDTTALNASNAEGTQSPAPAPTQLETITLGAGCFWCVEAVLEQIDGVHNVVSGYMGGETVDPTYKEVCGGRTGHAEVTQLTYDPAVLPTDHVLQWFWKLHDPTTLNRQGNDIGTQYRSVIFFHNDAQRAAAEASMKAAQGDFDSPIVTEITPATEFYVAEDDHQDYYRLNKSQGYCRAIIAPKLEKLNLEK